MEEKKKKKKKGAYGKVLGFCVLVGCIATALAWLGSGSLGFGGNGNFGLPFLGQQDSNDNGDNNGGEYYAPPEDNDTNNTDDTNGNDDDNGTNDNGDTVVDEPVELVIRVVGNAIYHGENEITAEELVRLFNDVNQPGFTWELRDEQAIMETFENVRVLMRENGIYYTVR